MSKNDSSVLRRFAIALSFPGERREYAERIAKALLSAFRGEQGKRASATTTGTRLGNPNVLA